MKSITIKGSKRESVGKKSTRALRNADMVPCVVYGGDEVISFSAHELEFRKLVYTPNAHTVVIDLGDTKVDAIMQDIQFHPVTDRILHIDFYQIFDHKEVTLEIPVQTLGTPEGVIGGGVLRVINRKLHVKALPQNLPDVIEADISKMAIGDTLNVLDLEAEDFKIMHPDNTVICQVRRSRTLVVTADPDDLVDEDEEGEEGAEGEGEGADSPEATE